MCTQLLLMITFFIYNLNAKRKRRCEKKTKKIQQTKKLYFFVISPSKETSSQQEKKNWSVEFCEKRNLFSSTFPLNHPINLRGLRWWVCDRRNFANWETNIKEYILPYQLLLFLNFWYEKGWSENFFFSFRHFLLLLCTTRSRTISPNFAFSFSFLFILYAFCASLPACHTTTFFAVFFILLNI